MVVPSVDLKEESTATYSDCQQEQGSARWRSLGEALRLGNGEAAATPPEGMEEHQWFVGGEREARKRLGSSVAETIDVLPLPQAA
jgi:hypothetical protein